MLWEHKRGDSSPPILTNFYMFNRKRYIREYQKTWIAKRREEYLKDKICAKCGSVESLEIDHVNPDDKISHKIWSWSEERRDSELAKCQVLCSICHLNKTSKFLSKTNYHGTKQCYRKYKCRCELCINAMKIYWKRRDRRKSSVQPLGLTVIYKSIPV